MSDDVQSWLQTLPLNEPVTIDGEPVFLRAGSNGTELGVILMTSPTDADLLRASRVGFQSAMQYQAGLGIWDERDALVLSQWLPLVSNWADAAEPLEALLNQTALWRSALKSESPKPSAETSISERRIRAMLAEQR
jgi:hypothetical protein